MRSSERCTVLCRKSALELHVRGTSSKICARARARRGRAGGAGAGEGRCAAREVGTAAREARGERAGRCPSPRAAARLVEDGPLVLGAVRVGHVEELRHGLAVLAALALQRGGARLAVRRQVAQQHLPRHTPVLRGDARPARVAQRREVDDRRREDALKLGHALRLLVDERAVRAGLRSARGAPALARLLSQGRGLVWV